ncbi:TFIIF-interacting CTD phosphatases, including NLI-interacting factor [Phaffia rhodozyma]|uniref:RNA polymerase II subunit A C-terminal domain phosphatase n=1 Tax=Phaffia rhodozyma TaxID=264483 RepID=A0A0F7SN91_PHARH|nr:TFIIF-interacting CTD phosphatases, including NLI-interacting factor [Phaffia rhodozyma]
MDLSSSTPVLPPPIWPYPVTIQKLLLQPGDAVKRGDVLVRSPSFLPDFEAWALEGLTLRLLLGSEHSLRVLTTIHQLHYTFPDPEITTDKRTSSFISPHTGIVAAYSVRPGEVLHRGERPDGLIWITENCTHPVQLGGLCAVCGLDLTGTDHLVDGPSDTSRANIQMEHSTTSLTVTRQEASRVSNLSNEALLQSRRLSLIVDLDQTVVHATVDPTVGEWMSECGLFGGDSDGVKNGKGKNRSRNPNGNALRDVQRFKLEDETAGRRGRREEDDCWYYIKPRPGLKEFLRSLSELYEMHVYTMGTRSYAEAVCRVIDPGGKIFGGRILSRDESGSLTAKSIERLFPADTSMVVIIDDRSDVWEGSKRNLVKVVPYDFFIGIGDINSSFLPKIAPSLPSPSLASSSVVSPSQLINSQIGASLLKEATEVQHQVLEDQLEERPLQKLQDEIRQSEDRSPVPSRASSIDGTADSDTQLDEEEQTGEEEHKALLRDDDTELNRIEQILREVHHRYYSAIDAKEKIKPDVKPILDYIKRRVLRGCRIVFSGVIPLGTKPELFSLWRLAVQHGAVCEKNLSTGSTHLIARASGTQKVHEASRMDGGGTSRIHIVTPYWLIDSIAQWTHLPEWMYLLIPPSPSKQNTQEETTTPPGSPVRDLNEGSDSVADTGEEESEGVEGEEIPMLEVVEFDRDAADRELEAFLEGSDDDEEQDDDVEEEEEDGAIDPQDVIGGEEGAVSKQNDEFRSPLAEVSTPGPSISKAKRPRPSTPSDSSPGLPLLTSSDADFEKSIDFASRSNKSVFSPVKRARVIESGETHVGKENSSNQEDNIQEEGQEQDLDHSDNDDDVDIEDDNASDGDLDEEDEEWAKEFAGSLLSEFKQGGGDLSDDGENRGQGDG